MGFFGELLFEFLFEFLFETFFIFRIIVYIGIIFFIVYFFGETRVQTTEDVLKSAKRIAKVIRPHIALIGIANNPDNDELTEYINESTPNSKGGQIVSGSYDIQRKLHVVHEDSIEWMDISCNNNRKLYDVNGNIIVIGTPGPKIHTMVTYDLNGNIIEDSSVKTKKAVKKVIFMDPDDKKDEKGKLKKLYEEGYISKARYNSLMGDLNK